MSKVWVYQDRLGSPAKYIQQFAVRRGKSLSNLDYAALLSISAILLDLTAQNEHLQETIAQLKADHCGCLDEECPECGATLTEEGGGEVSDQIQLRCAWCKNIIRTGILINDNESHGICKRCRDTELKDWKKHRESLVGVEGTPVGGPVKAEPMFGSWTEYFIFVGKMALGIGIFGFITYIAMAIL